MGIFSILNGISKTLPRSKLQKSAKCLHSFITNKTTLSMGKLSAKSKSYADLWVGWKLLFWFCVSFSLWDLGELNPQKWCGGVRMKKPTISTDWAQNVLMRTWTNAVNRLTSLSSKFLSLNYSLNSPVLNCNLCLNILDIRLCHWGSNNTAFNSRVVKWPIFWGIGCWWADEEEGGSASWVVPNFVRTPTLPCIGEVVSFSGSLWGCKGLLQQGGE